MILSEWIYDLRSEKFSPVFLKGIEGELDDNELDRIGRKFDIVVGEFLMGEIDGREAETRMNQILIDEDIR